MNISLIDHHKKMSKYAKIATCYEVKGENNLNHKPVMYTVSGSHIY